MHRREFIRKAAVTLAWAAGVLAAGTYLRQFFPRRAGERRRIRLGPVSQYPVDTFTFLENHNMFLYRDHEGVRAVSAVCTHLGCIISSTPSGFECPCHGSCYDRLGEVVSGPAPRKLSWYRVGGLPDGRLVVDPGEEVGAGEIFKLS